MIPNPPPRGLGLALVVVLTMSALVATGAQAGEFTATAYPANGSGGQTTKHTFTVQGQKVECSTVTFTGTLAAKSSQVKVSPKYQGCTAFGFIGAIVDMNSCYVLVTTDAGSNTTGSVHHECSTPGDSITITAAGCVIHLPPQTPTVNKLDYKNVSPGVLVTVTVEGIHTSVTSGFGCTLTSIATDTSSKYTGSTQFNPQAGLTADIG